MITEIGVLAAGGFEKAFSVRPLVTIDRLSNVVLACQHLPVAPVCERVNQLQEIGCVPPGLPASTTTVGAVEVNDQFQVTDQLPFESVSNVVRWTPCRCARPSSRSRYGPGKR